MAAGGGGQTDTVSNGLKKLYPQVAQLMLAPDAAQHQQFIQGLQTAIQKYLSQQANQAVGGGQGGGQPGAMGGQPAGQPGAGQPPAPTQIAPGGGGGMAGLTPSPGNMDEMRRMLTATQNPG